MPDSWLGWAFAALLAALLAWAWLRPRPQLSAPSPAIQILVIAAVVSPFVTAFATALGDQLGRKVTVTPMSWWRRRRHRDEFEVTVAGAATAMFRIEVGPNLTDEARLALIDLAVERPELRGHLLRWSEDAKAWIPAPDTQSDS